MNQYLQNLVEQSLLFTFILTRIGGLFMTMPVFGTQNISVQIRVLLALAMSFVITPFYWGTGIPDSGNLMGLAVLLGREVLVGLAMGLSVNILFSGLQLAGQLISQTSGMSLADVYDPATDSNVPVFAQVLDATSIMVFLAIGGHRQIMQAMLDSFREYPPGKITFSDSLVHALTAIAQHSFVTGIRAAAPVMISLLLAVLIVALISRTLPQLNTMNLGFGLNALVLLGVLAFSLGTAIWIFQEETHFAIDIVHKELFPME